MGDILTAFTAEQEAAVRTELSQLVRYLRAANISKLEEDHWARIYCKANGHPEPTWSNLGFNDIIHEGLGVETKLLRSRRGSILEEVGRSLMHPAATRKITFDPSKSADECMITVLKQWADLIRDFRERVAATSADGQADIRWGVLLWATSLSEFLYFEERLEEPDLDQFRAEWSKGSHRGQPAPNLHIFEKATGKKRYSVTLPSKGAKIQPYFDIPSVNEGAHFFELPPDEAVPIWVPSDKHDEILEMLREKLGDAFTG